MVGADVIKRRRICEVFVMRKFDVRALSKTILEEKGEWDFWCVKQKEVGFDKDWRCSRVNDWVNGLARWKKCCLY